MFGHILDSVDSFFNLQFTVAQNTKCDKNVEPMTIYKKVAFQYNLKIL